MAGKRDLKLKRLLEDVYGSTLDEGFKKGKMETQFHYKAMLAMQKEQVNAIVLKNEAEGEVKAIAAKLELLDKLIPSQAMLLDKEKLESELRLAEARRADVKVPELDWFKLGEPQMYD